MESFKAADLLVLEDQPNGYKGQFSQIAVINGEHVCLRSHGNSGALQGFLLSHVISSLYVDNVCKQCFCP